VDLCPYGTKTPSVLTPSLAGVVEIKTALARVGIGEAHVVQEDSLLRIRLPDVELDRLSSLERQKELREIGASSGVRFVTVELLPLGLNYIPVNTLANSRGGPDQ